MEESSKAGKRIFRSKQEILRLLALQQESGLSVRRFCQQRSISTGTFYHWMQHVVEREVPPIKSSFTRIDVHAGSPALFAQVGAISIFQPVDADYLKKLAL